MTKPAVLALLLLSASQGALAFRCNGYLIDTGQTPFEVRGKCGDPHDSERRTVWRMQTTFQQQCQIVMEPSPAVTDQRNKTGPAKVVTAIPRQVCTSVPISYSVPVEEEIWFYQDTTVPKALHFENGHLIWVETLWRLRQ